MTTTGNRIVALDTNQAIAVLNNQGDAGNWILTFAEVVLPVIVVGELRYGAMKSKQSATNYQRIDNFVKHCRVSEIAAETANSYAAVRVQLKNSGTPIPENDVWIAAICMQHSYPLATSDRHFDLVTGLNLIKR